MQPDTAMRVLLALILLCLVVLVVQGFGCGERGRYQVTGMRAGSPLLIRVDSETGQTWKLELRAGANRWIPFPEPGEEPRQPQAGGREPAAESEARDGDDDAQASAAAPPAAAENGSAAAPAAAAMPPPTEAEIQLFIETLLGDELPPEVRAWTAQQLGAIEGAAVTDALLEALSDPEPEVVAAAASALSQRSDVRVAPALEQLSTHPHPDVRAVAEGLRLEALD